MNGKRLVTFRRLTHEPREQGKQGPDTRMKDVDKNFDSVLEK